MKRITFMALLFSAATVFGQKPVFKALANPKLHAGCYIGGGDKILANLSEDGGALFNLSGKDEVLTTIKKIRGYGEAYGNGQYKIYINNIFVRKGDGCLEDHRYKIKLVYKGKSYNYTFKGFCGC
jgi:hypothetical protein